MKVDWTMMAVVNAKTGAILGYTASPSFDPNIKAEHLQPAHRLARIRIKALTIFPTRIFRKFFLDGYHSVIS